MKQQNCSRVPVFSSHHHIKSFVKENIKKLSTCMYCTENVNNLRWNMINSRIILNEFLCYSILAARKRNYKKYNTPKIAVLQDEQNGNINYCIEFCVSAKERDRRAKCTLVVNFLNILYVPEAQLLLFNHR